MNRSEIETARAARSGGEPLRVIGEMFGVSRQRISQYLHPEKHSARVALNWAVKSGKLSRPKTCEACGVACTPDGHHPHYAERLKVKWLCKKCHGAANTRDRKRTSLSYSLSDLVSESPLLGLVIDGSKMRAARKYAGLALREVAPGMGISQMTLSRLERSNETTEDQALKFISVLNGG